MMTCKTCSLDAMTLARVNRALQDGEAVEKVAARFKISSASLFRHRLNHLQPMLADIKVTTDRSVFDVIASLCDALEDTESARMRASSKGQTALVLRSAGVQARLSRALFDELGLDSAAVAERLRVADALQGALFSLIRRAPTVASSLATELRGSDPALAREFDAIHEQATTKKDAA